MDEMTGALEAPLAHIGQLEGRSLNEAIARQLGYEQWRFIPWKDRPPLPSQTGRDAWYRWASTGYEPLAADDLDFANNFVLVSALPLPENTTYDEDCIHTEFGSGGRWIVRLIRFHRASAPGPWEKQELLVVDSRSTTEPKATAYARAWLLSQWSWPTSQRARTVSSRAVPCELLNRVSEAVLGDFGSDFVSHFLVPVEYFRLSPHKNLRLAFLNCARHVLIIRRFTFHGVDVPFDLGHLAVNHHKGRPWLRIRCLRRRLEVSKEAVCSS